MIEIKKLLTGLLFYNFLVFAGGKTYNGPDKNSLKRLERFHRRYSQVENKLRKKEYQKSRLIEIAKRHTDNKSKKLSANTIIKWGFPTLLALAVGASIIDPCQALDSDSYPACLDRAEVLQEADRVKEFLNKLAFLGAGYPLNDIDTIVCKNEYDHLRTYKSPSAGYRGWPLYSIVSAVLYFNPGLMETTFSNRIDKYTSYAPKCTTV